MRSSAARHLCLENPARHQRPRGDRPLNHHEVWEVKPWGRKKTLMDFRRSVDRLALYLQSIRADQPPARSEFEQAFRSLADTWQRETQFTSSVRKKILHPAYQRIIAMGKPALPLILSRLSNDSDDWLWALHTISGEEPAPPDATYSEAVTAWIRWGKERHLL